MHSSRKHISRDTQIQLVTVASFEDLRLTCALVYAVENTSVVQESWAQARILASMIFGICAQLVSAMIHCPFLL